MRESSRSKASSLSPSKISEDLHLDQSFDDPPHVCEKCRFGTSARVLYEPTVSNPLDAQASVLAVLESSNSKPFLQSTNLPDEIFLMIFDLLDTEDLLSLSQAWSKVAQMVGEYDVIRTRELRCFCLKKDYLSAKLGLGISLSKVEKGNFDWIGSDFDVLSEEAFNLGKYLSCSWVLC